MARKNLLSNLTAVNSDEVQPPAPPRRTGGAIGAVGKSFAQMRANSVIEVAADMIDAAGLQDRLGEDPDHDALVASLKEYGQQVPVLLRHSPNVEGRYEVVYGRRRVAALKVLGVPVRAMVRDLPDRDLILAQGQENSARKNLSFIEKVNFARQMRDMGFDRKIICDALSVDETVISRMLKVADAIPEEVIRAIGDAPKAGRDRWGALAARIKGRERDVLTAVNAVDGDSDMRFSAALETLQETKGQGAPAPVTHAWGRLTQGAKGTTISLGKQESAFADWLVQRMDALHEEFKGAQSEATKTGKED